MMLKDDYQKLFDAISPPAALELRTEKEILEMLNPKVKRSLRRTVCIAVIAAVLIIGVAFAAVSASGILDRLFLYSEPTLVARESIVRNPQQVSSEGVTLQVDEYLFDQNTLHFAWTVSSERENSVFYTTSYETSYESAADEEIAENSIGGTYGGYSSGEVGDNILIHLSPEASAYSGYAGYGYRSALQGEVNTHLTVHVYESNYATTPVEHALDLAFANPGDAASLALENARQIGVSEQMTAINGYNCFNDALQKLLDGDMEWDAAHEAALVESGVFKELTVLELDLSIMPGSAPKPRFELDSEQCFELSDATVILKTLTIDTACTLIEYEVRTDKVFNQNDIANNGVSYLFFDQDGNPLSISWQAQQLEDADGRHVWFFGCDGNPISESVTSITFVPNIPLGRFEGETPNAYYLRMKEAADPGQCFTISLK